MKKNKKKIILLLITCIFLYFVFVNLDVKELLNVMKQFNVWYILPLAVSILCSLSVRGMVFKQLLHNSIKPPISELAHLCITTAAMNIVLPARAGDIFRAFYVGHKYNTDKVKIFGTVMLERIFDIVVIFSFLLIGIFIYHKNQTAINLCSFAGICGIIGFAMVLYAYKYNKTDTICNFLIEKTKKFPLSDFIGKLISFVNKTDRKFFNGFGVIEHPKYLFTAILSSFGVWFFECLNFYMTMQGFGCEIHWSVTLFLISFIALACMVPSTSIFIGPYQMAVIAAFSLYNIGKETALAISIVEQAVVVISTSIIAVTFMMKNNISYKELKQDIKNSQQV